MFEIVWHCTEPEFTEGAEGGGSGEINRLRDAIVIDQVQKSHLNVDAVGVWSVTVYSNSCTVPGSKCGEGRDGHDPDLDRNKNLEAVRCRVINSAQPKNGVFPS